MEHCALVREKSRRLRSARDGQHGFALLLVFALAAAVAITLYMQLPRVAFEAQRDREEMLIQRGEQYKRAIELYVRKNNKYPQSIEELEKQQDVRYLRRRYKDPLTGDEEWRLVHIDAAGQLADSLVKKKKTEGETADTPSGTDDENVAENTALARQRSGDQLAASTAFPGSGNESQVASSQSSGGSQTQNPLDEGLVPIIDASGNVLDRTKSGAQTQQGQGDGQPADPNALGADGQGQQRQPRLGPGGIPIIEDPTTVVGQNQNSAGGPPIAPTSGSGTAAGFSRGGSLNASGSGTGNNSSSGQTSAQDLLQGMLTRPVPGGLQGIQQRRGIQSTNATAQGFGAGIAGVASKYEMRGIKVYDEQESIHKWEFVYDARASQSQANSNQTQRGGQAGRGPNSGSGFGGGSGGFGLGGGSGSSPNRNGGGNPRSPGLPSFTPGQPFGGSQGGATPRRPR